MWGWGLLYPFEIHRKKLWKIYFWYSKTPIVIILTFLQNLNPCLTLPCLYWHWTERLESASHPSPRATSHSWLSWEGQSVSPSCERLSSPWPWPTTQPAQWWVTSLIYLSSTSSYPSWPGRASESGSPPPARPGGLFVRKNHFFLFLQSTIPDSSSFSWRSSC